MPSAPLRILHLTAGSDAGGLSRYIYDLSSAMHSAGHQVAVAGERGAWHWLFEKAPFPWIDAPLKGNPFKLRRAARQLIRYLADHPVDLLHVHYRRCTLVARQIQKTVPVPEIQKTVPVPVLFTLHLSHIPLTWPRRYFTDFGDHTHVAAEESRQWLIDAAHIPPEKITLIPHGIHTENFPIATAAVKAQAKSALGFSATDTLAAFVGRLDTPKNEEWMLDLAAATRDQLPNLKILLVGEGPHEPALRQRIQQEYLAARVHLLGHRDPLPIYQAADALLLPSQREGFSLVCAEAMSTGVPILRTATAGTHELVLENTTGRSVPIDHDAFLTAARQFLSDPPALARMGNAAADHIRQHFTFDRQLQSTIALYQSLIQTNSKV